MLTAVEEEDPPEGVKENQHHGHKSCRERQRGVTKEQTALTWPAGLGRDGEGPGKGSRGTAGPDWECWGRPRAWEGWGRGVGRVTGTWHREM